MLAWLAALIAQATTVVPPSRPAPVAWLDAALAPGRWTYVRTPGGSEAMFADAGGPRLTLRCTLASRTVSLIRIGGPAAQTVLTSETQRRLAGSSLMPNDPLLDAIAFSRGRFALRGDGGDLLVLPSSPEAARSIEDCRI